MIFEESLFEDCSYLLGGTRTALNSRKLQRKHQPANQGPASPATHHLSNHQTLHWTSKSEHPWVIALRKVRRWRPRPFQIQNWCDVGMARKWPANTARPAIRSPNDERASIIHNFDQQRRPYAPPSHNYLSELSPSRSFLMRISALGCADLLALTD